MKNKFLFSAVVASVALCACTEGISSVVYTDDEAGLAHLGSPVVRSCKVLDKRIDNEIIPVEDTAMYLGLVGYTLRTYGIKVGNGVTYSTTRTVYNSLELGDEYPGCKLDVVED